MAVRDDADQPPSYRIASRVQRVGTRWVGRYPSAPADAVRQPVRDAVPVLDGISPAADPSGGRLASSCARLPAADAVGDDPQVDGRLRAARIAAAGSDA